jgi:serine protease Do
LPPEDPPRDVQTVSGRNPLGGAKVENLSPAAAVDLQMDLLSKGVVITGVTASSYAEGQGFQPGDIVRSVNGVTIARVGDLAKPLAASHWDLVIERAGRRIPISVDG